MNQQLYVLLLALTLLFTIAACDDERADWDYNIPPGGIGGGCDSNWIEDDNGDCYCPEDYQIIQYDCRKDLLDIEYFGQISGCDCTIEDLVVRLLPFDGSSTNTKDYLYVDFLGRTDGETRIFDKSSRIKSTIRVERFEGSTGDSLWGHTMFRDFTPCSRQGYYATMDSLSIDASHFTAIQTHTDTFKAQLHYWYVDEQASIGRSKKVCDFLLYK